MKIALYEIGQYTDSKLYYITRLQSIGEYGSISRIVISDAIKTKAYALSLLSAYNKHGLKPLSEFNYEA